MELYTSSSLYINAVQGMEYAAKIMHLDPNILERLRYPKRAVVVSIPIRLDDGQVKVFEGYRVQHNMSAGPGKGGIRYHPSVTLSETAALALKMTQKNALVGLPLGGAKGAVRCDPLLLSRQERQALTRRFTMEINTVIGPDKDIPAPDLGTDEQTMAWMMDTYSQLKGFAIPGVVTGKPIDVGGSLGRNEATGRGVVFTILEAMDYLGMDLGPDTKVAIQGFGKVALPAAKDLEKLGCKVVAVSDVNTGIYNPNGLPVKKVIRYMKKNRTLEGFPDAEAISNQDLLELECDILIPAAIDGVITEKNADKIKAKIIAEGANGPVTDAARELLVERGVFQIPDILCNAGGVIVSYFEWVQGIQNFFWSEAEVNSRLRNIMVKAFHKVIKTKNKYDIDMSTAAQIAGLEALSRAMLLRGFFP
jgi:glutamate dehydrogenase (NAD(P)+)